MSLYNHLLHGCISQDCAHNLYNYLGNVLVDTDYGGKHFDIPDWCV